MGLRQKYFLLFLILSTQAVFGLKCYYCGLYVDIYLPKLGFPTEGVVNCDNPAQIYCRDIISSCIKIIWNSKFSLKISFLIKYFQIRFYKLVSFQLTTTHRQCEMLAMKQVKSARAIVKFVVQDCVIRRKTTRVK